MTIAEKIRAETRAEQIAQDRENVRNDILLQILDELREMSVLLAKIDQNVARIENPR